MTKSQNTKNEQQKDLCITSEQLTEKWKDGELLSGWYYVELIRGEHRIDLYINDKNEWIDCPDEIIDKVLTQIPTYEEYQALLSDQLAKKDGEEIVAELEAENAQLKEQVNHLSRTQARQFVDNQKLQVKAEKAKDVVDIEAARKIKKLERELKKMREDLYAIANNVNPKFDVKKYAQTALSAKFTKYLKGK